MSFFLSFFVHALAVLHSASCVITETLLLGAA